MTKGLKPCPFCGSEPFMEKSTRYPKPRQEPVDGYTVVCKNFDCIICMADNWYRRSEKAAAKAWNTRYKRTCKKVPYTPEYGKRTPAVRLVCSECGTRIGERAGFCWNCGAEIVDD